MNTDSIVLLIVLTLVCILLVLTYSIWITVLQQKDGAANPVKSNIERPVMQPKASTMREASDESNTFERVVKREAENSSITHRENVYLSSDSILEDINSQMLKQSEHLVDEGMEGGLSDQLVDHTSAGTLDLDFNKFRRYVHKDVFTKDRKEGKILHRLIEYINASMDTWKQIKIDIAVTGNSGTGKSSLINALRKLKPFEQGAVGVGVVETTTNTKSYQYPNNLYVVLWDLPGVGTQTFTRENYLNEMDFARFDVVIIVSAGRFLENDIWLGKQMHDLRKNVIFVRTKIDIDINNEKRDTGRQFNEAECLKKIRTDMSRNIKEISDSGVFLVSSPDRSLYDFPALDKTINGFINIKEKAIRALVQELVENAIRNDQQTNKNEFDGRKIASIIYGFLPIPYLETGFGNLSVSKMRDICLEKFCIDDGSLEEMATELKISKTLLKSELRSYRNNYSGDSPQDLTEKRMWDNFERYSKYYIPVFGSFWSAYKTYATTKECLKEMCDIMADDELKLAIHLLNRLEEDLKPNQ